MTAAAVAERLGGRRVLRRVVASELDLAAAVRDGLPAASLEHVLSDLSGSDLSQTEVYRVVGNARTLQRRRTAGEPLSREESDRLARLARLVGRAEEALGDRAKALRWMAKPNRALGGERPLALLDSDAGSLAVERVLGRIEHGVFA